MHHVVQGYRGFALIMSVNYDRLLAATMVAAGLVCGAMMGSMLLSI
jgi:hypothetical protein